MTWVRTVSEHEAEGYVKTLYEGLIKQRGWITRVADALGVGLNKEYATLQKTDVSRGIQ